MRIDYGAILSTVIKDTSDAIREVNDTSALIAPNAWGTQIRTMHSDADYENALSYIPTKTVSGAVASFNDGAGGLNLKSLKVAINATQSGSGDPYPAGGGKNKMPDVFTPLPATNTQLVDYGTDISFTGLYLSFVFSGQFSTLGGAFIQAKDSNGSTTVTFTFSNLRDEDNNALSANTQYTNKLVHISHSSTIAVKKWTFFRNWNPSNDATIKNFMLAIGNTAVDYAPYSNIRPFIGVSECNVCNTPMPVSQLWTIDSSFNGHVEFNQLFNINGTIGKNNGTVDITNNVLTFTTTYKSTYQYINQTIAFPQNHKFLISVDITLSQNENVAFGDGSTIFNVTAVSANTKTRINRVFNYPNARNSFYIYPARNAGLDIGETMVAENFLVIDITQMFGSTIADYIYSLEQGEAGAGVAFFRSIYPNDYYAYDTGTDEMVGSREGNTYTIQLGDTYYGGSLDVTNGVLTVDWYAYDLGNFNWTENASYSNVFNTPLISTTYTTADRESIISDIYPIYLSTDVMNHDYGISIAVSRRQFYVKNKDYSTASDFKTAMTGHMVVWKLATPITVQLTPTQIEQLLGANNVWADTGDINECIYYSTASGVQSVEGEYQRADATGVSSVPYLIYTYTATEDCTMCFCGTIATDTSQSQGFLKMVVNDDVEYRTAGLTQYNETPFSFDNISLQSGDTVKFYGDWEGSHSGCFFHLRLSMVKAV